MERHATVKVFRYVEEVDAFLPTREYLAVVEALGLREWNPAVWIGRLFCMDNDFDGKDGPCNPPQLRKRFWTEVLRSLELSYELLFDKARQRNEELRESLPSAVLDKVNIQDLEERIGQVRVALKEAHTKGDRAGDR